MKWNFTVLWTLFCHFVFSSLLNQNREGKFVKLSFPYVSNKPLHSWISTQHGLSLFLLRFDPFPLVGKLNTACHFYYILISPLQTGEICLDILKNAWSPAWTLQSVCRAIIALMAHPEADSPLNCDSGNFSVNFSMVLQPFCFPTSFFGCLNCCCCCLIIAISISHFCMI